ncbi:hypothetical protein FJY94_03680 [Candidatus Kaiserbacteria bacterium]|nr:hypothetical protein [Candidatus Kaiserbacteria bacterium]
MKLFESALISIIIILFIFATLFAGIFLLEAPIATIAAISFVLFVTSNPFELLNGLIPEKARRFTSVARLSVFMAVAVLVVGGIVLFAIFLRAVNAVFPIF